MAGKARRLLLIRLPFICLNVLIFLWTACFEKRVKQGLPKA